MKESLDNSEDSFLFQTGNTKLSDEVNLTAQKGEVLKYQIRQQMKYEIGSDLLKTWTNNIRTSTDLQKQITDIKGQISKDEKEAQKQQEDRENTKKSDKKDNEQIKPSAKKDPRKGFMKLLKEGSVSLVMGKKKVSDLPIDIVYGKKDTTKQKIWDFMNRKTMEKEMDKLKETSSADSFTSELPVIFYAQKYFHCLTDTSKKEGTKYEIEYLIAGKDSEKENLGAVFWKMIALRFLTNAACVYQDPVKEKEATLLAASVLGITGFPPVVAVAKNLLLIALAYGESVICLLYTSPSPRDS